MDKSFEKALTKTIKTDARALGLPSGSTEIFIDRVLKEVKKFLKTHPHPSESELKRLVVKELKKYHADLAYVYQNRDTIV